jgi:hypothetical protein
MKCSTLTALAVSTLACGVVSAGPHTTKRVGEAVEGYVDALSTHNARTLSKFFTDDAVVEFVSDASGVSVTVHADSLVDDGAASLNGGSSRSHVTNLRVFPTKDVNAVFVQYDVVGDSAANGDVGASGQLALIEMRGNRIEKMVNFNAPAASIARSSACAAPRDVVATRR